MTLEGSLLICKRTERKAASGYTIDETHLDAVRGFI